MQLNHLDLFAGIGGFTLGFEWASTQERSFKPLAFCEIEEFPQKVLRKNWPNVPIYPDVRELTADRIISDGLPLPDIITGGFPCQDLSSSGAGDGIDGSRSGLFREIIRLLGESRPKYLVMENSPNLFRGGGGSWARTLFGELARIGYDAEWGIVPASSVGAPHRRERAWVIAYPTGERQCKQRRFNPAFNQAPDAYREADRLVHAFQGGALPYVCGRHDGVSGGAHRLAALGNAIVPQIAQIIGAAILEDHAQSLTPPQPT